MSLHIPEFFLVSIPIRFERLERFELFERADTFIESPDSPAPARVQEFADRFVLPP